MRINNALQQVAPPSSSSFSTARVANQPEQQASSSQGVGPAASYNPTPEAQNLAAQASERTANAPAPGTENVIAAINSNGDRSTSAINANNANALTANADNTNNVSALAREANNNATATNINNANTPVASNNNANASAIRAGNDNANATANNPLNRPDRTEQDNAAEANNNEPSPMDEARRQSERLRAQMDNIETRLSGTASAASTLSLVRQLETLATSYSGMQFM